MELQERLKAVRKHFKMTQVDFGKALGCSRDTIANYEGGRAMPTDTFLQLICAKFPINESWLTTEQGSMVLDNETTLFSTFAKQYNLNEAEQNAARFLLTMRAEERRKMLHYVTLLADAVKNGAKQGNTIDIDAETAAYRDELEAIQRAGAQGKQSPYDATAGEEEA